ncbi:MAG: stage III sporulation protein AF [Eubacteriales bacterium]|nr:stage III sporulation protein AF [Eubacteriales bacterium]
MKEEIYEWMKNLAVFYILLTAVLHLVPNDKYERYVRFFMGLLLIFMLCTPIFSIFGKSQELRDTFQSFYRQESALREEQEMSNLQELYLKQGYASEIEEKILQSLKNRGIELTDVEVHIEGERVTAALCVEEQPNEEQERGIADGLMEACGIRQGEYQIKIAEHEPNTVGGTAASGGASGRDGAAGVS